MLQRIQTVFLALVALAMLLTIFFPIWYIPADSSQGTVVLFALYLDHTATDGASTVTSFPFLWVAILAIASTTLAVTEITRYKKRTLQMKLGSLNSLVMAGTMFLAVYFIRELRLEFNQEGAIGIGLFLPGVGIIFNILANFFIRKDEKLVRSVDRIR